jgi:hypothetical protein
VHASVVSLTFQQGVDPEKSSFKYQHPTINLINVLKYQPVDVPATTAGGRFVIIGANKPAWVMAHECGGHCAGLPDIDKGDPNYDFDIMGGWGNPVTDSAVENIISINEGPNWRKPPTRNEPAKRGANAVNGCPANSAQPLTCAGGIDEIWQ